MPENNGPPPIIGVVLMVAITVVLTVVIGAFVFGIGDRADTQEQSVDCEYVVSVEPAGADTLVVFNESVTATVALEYTAQDGTRRVTSVDVEDGMIARLDADTAAYDYMSLRIHDNQTDEWDECTVVYDAV